MGVKSSTVQTIMLLLHVKHKLTALKYSHALRTSNRDSGPIPAPRRLIFKPIVEVSEAKKYQNENERRYMALKSLVEESGNMLHALRME
jgi:hypothetical protein